jgi:copper chaperone CopZ
MTIEEAGSALSGVKSIVADLETKAVEVSFDENVVALEDIKNALTQAGYPPE